MGDFTIYRDVPVRIYHKIACVRKIGGRLRRKFTYDYGDIPVATLNRITGKMMAVDNHRGYAYAYRADSRVWSKGRKKN